MPLFENGYRGPDIAQGTQASMWATPQSYSPDASYFPAFEPFAETSAHSISRGQPPLPSQVQAERRRLDMNVLPPTLPPLSWGGQRFRTSSEWLKADDTVDRGAQFHQTEMAFRSTQTQSVPPHRQVSSQVHEVRQPISCLISLRLNWRHGGSPSISFPSCILPQLRPTTCS